MNSNTTASKTCKTCYACGGTGLFRKGSFVGKCFRCIGKGIQTVADKARNNYYDSNIRGAY